MPQPLMAPPQGSCSAMVPVVRSLPQAVRPCLGATGPHRCWWFDRRPGLSDRASTATGPHHCWRSDCPWNRSWWSDCHPERSDRPTLHGFRCTPHDDHDCTRATHSPSVPDSTCAFSGSDVLTQLASPSGCARATVTASTSAITALSGAHFHPC
jgi:hypothetical protein